MNTTRRLAVLCSSICVVAACAHRNSIPGVDTCTPRPGEIFGATADSLTGGTAVASAGGVVDTERMLHPDPAVRTYNHLYGLRNKLRRFQAANNRFPAAIEEFSPHDAPGIKFNLDGWGSSIRYTRMSDVDYELRAPGPDHTLCTHDDMVVQNDSLPARPALGDPES